MNDEQQREMAQHLLGELDSVIDDEGDRQAVRAGIDEALALPGPEGARRLTDVLRARAETRTWMREHDPDADVDRIVQLGGDLTGPLGTYFVCPNHDYDFHREHIGEEVPLCPTCKVPLVAAGK